MQIKDSLEKKYNNNQPFATNIAFQIAFCFLIGFGIKSDDNACYLWLEKSNKQPNDLKIEKEAVQQPVSWKSGRLNELVTVNLVHEYRTWGWNKLEEARKEYEREVRDMTREFGELHFVPLGLYTTIGDLLNGSGKFTESKMVRMQTRDKFEKPKE